jgi:hypothetical protein
MVFQACPISGESRNERVARIVAAFVVAIVLVAADLGSPWDALILFVLAADFVVRGFGDARRSPLATLARGVANTLRLAPKPVDAAPEKFAARIGVVFSALSGLLFVVGLPVPALVVIGVFVVCATLEAALGYCVGCKVYALLPRPVARALAK